MKQDYHITPYVLSKEYLKKENIEKYSDQFGFTDLTIVAAYQSKKDFEENYLGDSKGGTKPKIDKEKIAEAEVIISLMLAQRYAEPIWGRKKEALKFALYQVRKEGV